MQGADMILRGNEDTMMPGGGIQKNIRSCLILKNGFFWSLTITVCFPLTEAGLRAEKPYRWKK